MTNNGATATLTLMDSQQEYRYTRHVRVLVRMYL